MIQGFGIGFMWGGGILYHIIGENEFNGTIGIGVQPKYTPLLNYHFDMQVYIISRRRICIMNISKEFIGVSQ